MKHFVVLYKFEQLLDNLLALRITDCTWYLFRDRTHWIKFNTYLTDEFRKIYFNLFCASRIFETFIQSHITKWTMYMIQLQPF